MTGRFAGERVLVVGAGVAGASAARVLQDAGAEVRVSEARAEAELPTLMDLRSAGIDVRAGGHDPVHLVDATLVVTGPGVPPSAPILRWARDVGLPVWGEMELGAQLATAPYLAVTGTNGKTTTSGMIASALQAAGRDAVACGNIGRPFPITATESHDVLVVEVSSFQLALQESFHPVVSVLLNLAPDHLDWHGSYEAYVDAKARIFRLQHEGETHVANRDDARAAAVSADAPCRVTWFTGATPETGEVGYEHGELTARLDETVHLGRIEERRAGYREDAAAAASALLAFGVESVAVREGLAGFEPGAHRGEVVAVVGGVRFIDNSKATNVHAALAAIAAASHPVLIAGGRSKGADLSGLRAAAAHLRAVVAIGEAASELVGIMDGVVPTTSAASIEAAVAEAFSVASPEGTVLLAPACASWDQFADYTERGDRFTAAARDLLEVSAGGRS